MCCQPRSRSRSNPSYGTSQANHIPEQSLGLITIPILVLVLALVKFALVLVLVIDMSDKCKAYDEYQKTLECTPDKYFWFPWIVIEIALVLTVALYTMITQLKAYRIYNYWVVLCLWIFLWFIGHDWVGWADLLLQNHWAGLVGYVLQGIHQFCVLVYIILFGICIGRHRSNGGTSRYTGMTRPNDNVELDNLQAGSVRVQGSNNDPVDINIRIVPQDDPTFDGAGGANSPRPLSFGLELPPATNPNRARAHYVPGEGQNPLGMHSVDSINAFPVLHSSHDVV